MAISSNYKKNNYNINQLLADYKNKDLINDNIKSVLSLYFNASMQSQNFNDYKTITDYYVNNIQNSNLTSKEKESLYAAFSVSIQSYYYWLNLEVEVI